MMLFNKLMEKNQSEFPSNKIEAKDRCQSVAETMVETSWLRADQ
jgi:hypothetical protein